MPLNPSSKNKHSAKWSIQNVVVSVRLNRDINLKKVTEAYRDAEENMNRFPGICLHLSNPKCAILLFANGKLVITGLKDSEDAPIVVNRIIERLENIGIEVNDKPDFKVVNIVVSLELSIGYINLDRASLFLDHSIYEPEVFPGLIYRISDPRAVFLIFSSGKVVLTGLTDKSQIPTTIQNFGKTLRTHGLLQSQSDSDLLAFEDTQLLK